MVRNVFLFQEKRLLERLAELKVEGKVIGKKTTESLYGQPERKVVIKFKDRIIEMEADNTQFGQVHVGGQIWLSPPPTDRDPCNCHLFVWLIVGLTAGALAFWAITSHSPGIIGNLISLFVAALISVIVWTRICSHEQNKRLRDLERDFTFFKTKGDDK